MEQIYGGSRNDNAQKTQMHTIHTQREKYHTFYMHITYFIQGDQTLVFNYIFLEFT